MITVDQNTRLEIGKKYRIKSLAEGDQLKGKGFEKKVVTYAGAGPLFKKHGDPMHYCFLYGLTVEEL